MEKFTLKQAVAKIRSMAKGLARNADSIAVQLYNEKVRGAKCGSATKCALAQYFANALPSGFMVSVGGYSATVREIATQETADVNLNERAEFFVENFDSGAYGFLCSKTA